MLTNKLKMLTKQIEVFYFRKAARRDQHRLWVAAKTLGVLAACRIIPQDKSTKIAA